VEIRAKISKTLKELQNSPSLTVTVLDTSTTLTTIYSSIRLAARALNSNHTTIRRYISFKKIFRNHYLIYYTQG